MRGKYYKEKYRVIWQNRNVGWIYLREMKIYVTQIPVYKYL